MSNRTLIQYFEWFLPADGRHWQRVAADAAHLAELGISDVWLPPAYKGHAGMLDVGYGVYDLYDLGEFYQKNAIPTKYGTKDEYIAAIDALRAQGIGVLGDIVLNHRMGGDYSEDITGTKVKSHNRMLPLVKGKKLRVRTGFNFPGRNGKYSSFRWNASHFSGYDWNERTNKGGIFKFDGHRWSLEVDNEKGNFDYLMGANVDFSNPAVVTELERWGKWYMDTTGIAGVRLDAVKHIPHSFFPKWLKALRQHTGREFFAVGEYWNGDPDKLMDYLNNCGKCMSLFDAALHFHFHDASKQARYNLCTIFDNTLLSRAPEYAVTFVDNHDTQPEQALESWVRGWFKPLAYAMILLRSQGTPCVFYGDLYGIPHNDVAPVPGLEQMLKARKHWAEGRQTDYFDHPNVIGWTREKGMAVVVSSGSDGWKDMKLGTPDQVFVDLLGNRSEEVTIGSNGFGRFNVNSRSVSVWVPKE